MAVSTVASVHDLAADYLSACETVLATTVGGAPAASFLSPGLPALDRQCDMLTVYETAPVVIGQSGATSPGTSMRFGIQTRVGLNAQISRCIPVARETNQRYQPPTTEQLTDAAVKVMEDGWALWNGIVTQLRDGSLYEGWPCDNVDFLAMTPLDPQGGMAGWTLSLAVDLDGYTVGV